ncbi:MAG: sigma-70 family RNA polymerase sigma factor [Myxococcales bacterium]|nr:sigma-70 family RNA polymerase sigma factor [Myxococcales bacterium]
MRVDGIAFTSPAGLEDSTSYSYRAEAGDEELYARWVAGDEVAGDVLTRRRLPGIRRVIESLLTGAEAQDALQQVFERLAARARAGVGIEEVKPFLAGVARNIVRERLRGQRREGLGAEVDFGERSLVDLRPDQSAEMERRESNRLLLKALHRMPVDDQILLALRYWERLRTRQLAEILELNPSTARTRLQRAEARLRELVSALAESPEALESTLGSLSGWAREHRDKVLAQPE